MQIVHQVGAEHLGERSKIGVDQELALPGRFRGDEVLSIEERAHPPATAICNGALEQQVLYVAQRQRVLHVHHHHQADHLGRWVEVAEGVGGPGHGRIVTGPVLTLV
jgi:hypothetical protein